MPCPYPRQPITATPSRIPLALGDEELRHGEVSRDARGLPILWSGNFASVYRIHCPPTGKTWALKCFTREVIARQERYRHIAAALEAARLPFTVPFVYLERGIQVHGQWYPGRQNGVGGGADPESIRGRVAGEAQDAAAVAGPLAQVGRPAPRRRDRPCRPPARQRPLGARGRRQIGPEADRLRRHVRAGPGGHAVGRVGPPQLPASRSACGTAPTTPTWTASPTW